MFDLVGCRLVLREDALSCALLVGVDLGPIFGHVEGIALSGPTAISQ
jgi:hypothetical protein